MSMLALFLQLEAVFNQTTSFTDMAQSKGNATSFRVHAYLMRNPRSAARAQQMEGVGKKSVSSRRLSCMPQVVEMSSSFTSQRIV
mmetsp:Transcript_50409/g.80037  ORF Transcript_50409/g.80037 Transcript_50409/m.80037 type:complete len:85 (+) Transcript_50409:347-601(+)